MKDKATILIVEDEPVVAADIKSSLQSAGYKIVGVVSTGEDAVLLAKQKRPDLILMDIQLKGQLSGIDTVRRINTVLDVPVIYLTAHTDGHTITEAKTTTPFGFIVKPFQEIELQTSIEMALHKFSIDKQVRESEHFLSSTFRSLGDGVIVADRGLKVTYINPYAVMMTGWTDSEAVGNDLDTVFLVKDESTDKPISHVARTVLKKEQPAEFVNRMVLVSREGGNLPVDTSIAPVKGDTGETTGIVLVFHDTLDRKLTEIALKESENRYRSLFEESNDAIFILNRNGDFITANRAMQHLFGFEENELVDYALGQLFQDAAAWPDMQRRIEKNGSVRDYQSKMVTGRSTVIDCLITASLRRSGTGEILGYQGILRDITEKKRSEEALKQSETRYRLLAENIVDIIWTMDEDLNFTYVTPSVSDILGYNAAEFLTLDLERLCTHESYPSAAEYFSTFVPNNDDAGDKQVNIELELKKADGGTVWVNVSSSVFRAEDGTRAGIIGVAHDITKRKIAEKEKELMREQFLQAQKMEAIGILAGGVAHDFNNLLTVIQGSTDLLMMQVQEDDPVYIDLYEIHKAAIRAAELTSQLLLFSRKKSMRSVPLNLNRIVEDLLKMLHRLIGEDVGIITHLADDLWTISADRSNMEQVIMNIVVNARDAMPEGGEVTITSKNLTLTESDTAAAPKGPIPGSYVCLTIADEGTGIDEAALKHIFEPFYSTKGTGKGTGLGLSVVYGIVKQHQGWLDVESTVGKGTTFRLYFPALLQDQRQKDAGMATLASLSGDSENVLLVEDEEGVRHFAMRALRSHGYEVTGAATAEEALDLFGRDPSGYHLIISDVVLPGHNGIELVERVLRVRPEIPVLLCSGYTDQKSQWTVIQQKGYRYLQKPYSVNELLRTVKDILTPFKASFNVKQS
ncbi:PAS domain S-box protein [bacterium]|nr:PAS domain S-box protein [bacterium]